MSTGEKTWTDVVVEWRRNPHNEHLEQLLDRKYEPPVEKTDDIRKCAEAWFLPHNAQDPYTAEQVVDNLEAHIRKHLGEREDASPKT